MKTTILYMFLYHLTSFSSADDCFTMADSCPDTREKWIERANEYNCTSGKLYTCLMNINGTLVEACSYSRYIDPSRAGCPVFALCTIEDGALIDNNLKPCAEGVIGCPTSNHSGYYLTEMFKYPACLINSFEEKENRTGILLQSTSPVPFGRPDTKSAGNGALVSIIVIPLALVSFLAIVFVIIFRIRKSPALKQTNGNKEMLETSSHHKFSEEESRNVPGIPNDEIESFAREHNTLVESDLQEFQFLNKGNDKGSSNKYYTNQNMRTTSNVLPLVDLDTRMSDRKSCTTETDELQSCSQAIVDNTRREWRKNKLSTGVHQPLLGDPNLDEIPKGGDQIQISSSSIQLLDDRVISASPTRCTDSIQSTLKQTNENDDMLETKNGDEFSTEEPPTRTRITYDENKTLTDEHQPLLGDPTLEEIPNGEEVSDQIQMSNSSIKLPDDDMINGSPTWSTVSIQSISIPSEIMHYLKATNFKKVCSSLNITTMKLLTEAPQAIGHVGRLHFIANLTSFQIGADSLEGQDLRMQASEFGEESNKCFEIAKNNILEIKFSLNVVIERLCTLSSIMSDECHESSSEGISIFIDSITVGINECAKRCDETEETFMRLLKRLQPFDNSFQRAKKKVDAVQSFDSEGRHNLTLSRVTSSLRNIRELIDETEDLFTELCNRWINIKDFFRNMHSLFTTGLKNDIILYSKLSVVKMKSSNGDKSTLKIHYPDLMEDVLRNLQLKARYGQIVSEFYLFVSKEILADCLQQLSRSLYLEDQKDIARMKSSIERLKRMCVDAENKVAYLCDKIERLIKQ